MKTLNKKITIIVSLGIILSLQVFAQENKKENDTTEFKLGTTKFMIINEKDTANATDSIVKNKKKHKFKGHWGSFDIGVNGFVNGDNKMELPAGYEFLELKQNKSLSVAFGIFNQNINLYRNHIGLQTGLGIEFNNYRFDKKTVLSTDSSTIFGYNDTIFESIKSKLVIPYITVPFLLEYQTNNKSKNNSFHISGGIIFGFNVDSYTKREFYNDNKRGQTKVHDDYHLNPFKYELTARIGWGKINLFANYGLSEMFKTNKGPVLHPFTIGITLINS